MLTDTDSELHPRLKEQKLLRVLPLQNSQALQSSRAPFLLLGPLKVIWQLLQLWLVLGVWTKPAKWLLVQVRFQCSMRGSI